MYEAIEERAREYRSNWIAIAEKEDRACSIGAGKQNERQLLIRHLEQQRRERVRIPAIVPRQARSTSSILEHEPAEAVGESPSGRRYARRPDLLLGVRTVDDVAVDRDVVLSEVHHGRDQPRGGGDVRKRRCKGGRLDH